MSKIVPDFSQISFPSNDNLGRTTGITQSDEKINLSRIFNAVITHERLDVNQDQLNQIIFENLGTLVHPQDERLQAILREALVYYMMTWPDWQRSEEYHKGQLGLMDWYASFQKYLVDKSKLLIKDAAIYYAYKKKNVTQMGPKNSAGYTLAISGPPSVLNNIIFEESDGDVIIKQQTAKPWCNLTLKEFINWPYVSINVKLPDISFTRTNTHQFQRYLTSHDDVTALPEQQHIKYIKKLSINENELVPYAYSYISAYLHCFYKTVQNISGININRLQELKAIFNEFLLDIEEANVCNCSMCTNTSVGYNIGKSKYIRKNLVKKMNNNTIEYYEVLTPQVDFTLNYFSAIQDVNNSERVAFKIINQVSNVSHQRSIKNLKYLINSNIAMVYTCTLCLETFSGLDTVDTYCALTKHFAEVHKGQPAVKCCKCGVEFEVKDLANQRWSHTCV